MDKDPIELEEEISVVPEGSEEGEETPLSDEQEATTETPDENQDEEVITVEPNGETPPPDDIGPYPEDEEKESSPELIKQMEEESVSDNSIMTADEFDKLQEKEEQDKSKSKKPKAEKPAKTIKEIQAVEMKFECSFAPMGESNVAISYKHKGDLEESLYELKLQNKIFIIPVDSKKDKEEQKIETNRYREMLRANSFMDVTVLEAGGIFDEVKKEYVYKVVHPEHTERNRINGSITLVLLDDQGNAMYYDKGNLKGQQIAKQVNIINGMVETDDPQVYDALLKAGFYTSAQIEKEKEV